jgi:hypothetical protein
MFATSCGSDELKGGGHGGGGIIGGAGGAAGSTAKGGSGGGSTNAGTGGGSAKSGNLGKACVDDSNCGAALGCLVGDEIPQGFCTADCTKDSDCEAVSPGALCTSTDGSDGICVQGCQVGSGSLTQKCQGREDFTCQLYSVDDTGIICKRDADCAEAGPAFFCSSGTCIATACLPTCANDAECGNGFCNLRTGLCQAEPPEGLPLGSACDANAPAAQDVCAGLCIGDQDNTFSLCSGFCNLGLPTSCGWDGTGKADAACLFGQAFNTMPDVGDAGYCAQLCDCSSDCRNPKFGCVALTANEAKVVGRLGYCTIAEDTDTVLTTCPASGGSNGNGGAGGEAGATSGGAGGAGGGAGGASG